jgi:hypothetical protein
MALPHIKNSTAGINLNYEPVNKSIFQVSFDLPNGIKNEFSSDIAILTEHVQKVSGLDQLYKTPETDIQKFMGTSRSYIKPTVGDTHVDFEIEFSLNLRNGTDNYILKLFRAWAALGYDLSSGKRSLKKDYTAPHMVISIANRAGDIFQEIKFKDVMLNGALSGGISELDYTSDDMCTLTVKFRSDYWEEVNV